MPAIFLQSEDLLSATIAGLHSIDSPKVTLRLLRLAYDVVDEFRHVEHIHVAVVVQVAADAHIVAVSKAVFHNC